MRSIALLLLTGLYIGLAARCTSPAPERDVVVVVQDDAGIIAARLTDERGLHFTPAPPGADASSLERSGGDLWLWADERVLQTNAVRLIYRTLPSEAVVGRINAQIDSALTTAKQLISSDHPEHAKLWITHIDVRLQSLEALNNEH
jgi:hypothetical protein